MLSLIVQDSGSVFLATPHPLTLALLPDFKFSLALTDSEMNTSLPSLQNPIALVLEPIVMLLNGRSSDSALKLSLNGLPLTARCFYVLSIITGRS